MSDSKRFGVVAKWCKRQLPKISNVADIAGGNGLLSSEFVKLGINSTSFDMRPKKRVEHKDYRRGDIGNVHFDPQQFDCVVGLHPDEATWHVIRLAQEAQCPFVIIPCCKCPPEGMKVDREWIPWLVNQANLMGFEIRVANVAIKGENTAIIGTRKL